jgi:hypothetical protein
VKGQAEKEAQEECLGTNRMELELQAESDQWKDAVRIHRCDRRTLVPLLPISLTYTAATVATSGMGASLSVTPVVIFPYTMTSSQHGSHWESSFLQDSKHKCSRARDRGSASVSLQGHIC